MKKILIGLFTLSILELGVFMFSTSAEGTSLEITTRAFVINKGLIVTDSPTGTAALSSLKLDHGSVTAGETSITASDVYIRNVAGESLPDGTKITMELIADQGNTLKSPQATEVPHILLAAIAREDAEYVPGSGDNSVKNNVLTLQGDMTTNKGEFSVNQGKSSVKVSLKSELPTTTNTIEAEYTNSSQLNITLSKTL